MGATDEANEFIDEVLREWAPFVISQLHATIQQQKLILSEDLLKSLRWELTRATVGSVAKAQLYFRMHGRWRDMKIIRGYKQPPVDIILKEFVETLGISNFKYVPGYKSGRFPTDNRALRRIAWGISRKIQLKSQTAARKWYAKKFYGTINVLIEGLMGKYQQVASDTLTKNI